MDLSTITTDDLLAEVARGIEGQTKPEPTAAEVALAALVRATARAIAAQDAANKAQDAATKAGMAYAEAVAAEEAA